MSFSFLSLLKSAEAALESAAPAVQPAIAAAEAIAPVVEAMVPSTAPAINAVEAGAASIAAIAPSALTDAKAIIAAGKQAYADLAPSLKEFESMFSRLYDMTPAGQSIVLTPKTTVATAPLTMAAPAAAFTTPHA